MCHLYHSYMTLQEDTRGIWRGDISLFHDISQYNPTISHCITVVSPFFPMKFGVASGPMARLRWHGRAAGVATGNGDGTGTNRRINRGDLWMCLYIYIYYIHIYIYGTVKVVVFMWWYLCVVLIWGYDWWWYLVVTSGKVLNRIECDWHGMLRGIM